MPSLSIRLLLAGTLTCAVAAGCRAADTTGETDPPDASGGGGSTHSPEPLTIVTWNVHNLVDDQRDGAPQEWVEPTAEWTSHRAAVGKVLADIDADIVVLQEVEHLGVLTSLNSEELADRYDHLILEDGNDPRGIDVGMLSKLPATRVVSHADEEFTVENDPTLTYQYSRDCLEVHLTFNGRPLVLLGVHYRSKENDNPRKRLAEAQRTRAIANEITAGAPHTGVAILGDFNDTPGSLPYDWTLGLIQDHPERYTNAADDVPAGDRWTFDYMGTRELVDQFMASPVLTPMLESGSTQIWHTADIDAASDHAPVIATFQIN